MPIPAPPPPDSSSLSYAPPPADDGPPLTYQLGGLIFNGPRDSNGVRWYAAELDGWDSADVRSTLDDRSGDHGAYAGQFYYSARNLTLTGTFEAPNETAMFDARRRLHTATNLLGPGYGPLQVNEQPPKLVNVRRSGRLQMRSIGKHVVQFQVGLIAPDPRKYATIPTVLSTGLPAPAPGLVFPLTFPINFGPASIGGSVTFHNPGSDPARPVIDIHGPAVNPQIAVPALSHVIQLAATLGDDDVLTLDMAARTVQLNGGVSRRGHLVNRPAWIEFPPGDTTVTFRADRPSTSARMTLTASPVWL